MDRTYNLNSLKELLLNSVKNYGDRIAFTLKTTEGEKRNKTVKYEDKTYNDFKDDVYSIGTSMIRRGINTKKCAIIGKNSYEWFTAYTATLLGDGVTVPLDKGLPYEEIKLSIERSGSEVVFFDEANESVMDRIKEEEPDSSVIFISLEPESKYLTANSMIEEGKKILDEGDTSFDDIEIDEDKVSILLFTSGTTSLSKIVMLTQRNVATNTAAAINVEPFETTDVNMAFLPYHHTFGSTGQWVMIAIGAKTVFCDGLKYIQKNMAEYKVSVFISVPLLIESIYKKIIIGAEKQGKLKLLKFMGMVSNGLLKLGIDVRRKLFKSVLDQLGGELRFIICGAAAVDPEALKGFNGFGIVTVQGYGLTETSPILTAERPGHMKLGSVGVPLPDIEVKISDKNDQGIGEVIARGPNIMKGYYNNQKETDDVLKDGWFYTGDLGYIDKAGYLFLSGRKKNVLILKNGKNVYPEELELTYGNLPYIKENVVMGIPHADDERELTLYLKIVYDAEYFDVDKEEIEKIIRKDIDAINDTLPRYKQVRRVIITDEGLIKTTTAKVKRFEEIKLITKQ
ncbi:MAG: AMP-binding protein [Clostridiales bacterium]|nr:AMP-binding protein [Clostridiales bacterium]